MKKFFFIIASLLLFNHFVHAAEVRVSLEEALRIAVAQNPMVRSAKSDVRISEARSDEVRSQLFPNLSLFYNFTRQQSPLGPPIRSIFGPFQTQPYQLNFYRDGVALNQLLYDGERTLSTLRQAQHVADSSRADYRRFLQTLIYDTTAAYYRLLAARKLVNVNGDLYENAKAHLALAKANYRAGVAAKADLVFASVPVASAQLNLTKAKEMADQAEAGLNRLLAFDPDTRLELKDDFDPFNPSITQEHAFHSALQNREEIKHYESLVEAAKSQLQAAKGSFLPVITAFANYGYTDYGTKVIPGNLGWNYGLQGTFSLFNGNLQSSQVAEAQAFLEKNQALLESAKQSVLYEVKSAVVSVKASEQAIREAQVEFNRAKENLRLVEREYKVGVAIFLTLQDAQVSLTRAQTNYINTVLDYQTAGAKLTLAIGR